MYRKAAPAPAPAAPAPTTIGVVRAGLATLTGECHRGDHETCQAHGGVLRTPVGAAGLTHRLSPCACTCHRR